MKNVRREPTPNESIVLFNEVDGLCPLCNKSLMRTKNKIKVKIFEAAHIYPLNPSEQEIELLKNEERLTSDVNDLDNFIALCRECHKVFDHPRTVEEYKILYKIKKNIITRNATKEKFHEYPMETQIREVLIKLLGDINESSLTKLKLEAHKLDDKANGTLTGFTKRKIRNDITDYYLFIKEEFKQLDKDHPKSFAIIASQVRSFFTQVDRIEESQDEIYSIVTEWLYKKTQTDSIGACQIITSFFIQNCEVFDANSQ
ncbi:ABC-three component system protein [Cohnella sp. GCM10020058]|uniref:ABC-three component system protein n=1 Tax=Cohnella sp. GCM10020058 TaxID=3317330 RepID=UPI0036405DD9